VKLLLIQITRKLEEGEHQLVDMRKLNFRIWDKEDLLWIDPSHLQVNHCGLLYLPYGLAPQKNTERFEIQQFSGMFDKIGRRIYEGDIVKKYSEYYNCTTNFKIEFLKGVFGIYFGAPDDIPFPLIGPEKYFEVIGNIFENPELL